MATKLERVKLNEISGVDEPANLVPGWLFMKNAKGLEGVLAEVTKVHEDLRDSLEKAGVLFEDAPEDVKDAASALNQYVRELDEGGPAVEKTQVKFADRLRAILHKNDRKEDIDMTKDELQETLAASNEELAKTITAGLADVLKSGLESIAKSVTPAPEDKDAEAEAAAAAAAADEKDQKIEELQSVLEAEKADHEATRDALVSTVDRVEAIEKRLAVGSRSALHGQESAVEKNEGPTLKDAFAGALQGKSVTLS